MWICYCSSLHKTCCFWFSFLCNLAYFSLFSLFLFFKKDFLTVIFPLRPFQFLVYHFMSVKLCYFWHFSTHSAKEMGTNNAFFNTLLVTKCLKIQCKSASLPNCQLCVCGSLGAFILLPRFGSVFVFLKKKFFIEREEYTLVVYNYNTICSPHIFVLFFSYTNRYNSTHTDTNA